MLFCHVGAAFICLVISLLLYMSDACHYLIIWHMLGAHMWAGVGTFLYVTCCYFVASQLDELLALSQLPLGVLLFFYLVYLAYYLFACIEGLTTLSRIHAAHSLYFISVALYVFIC